MRKLFFHLVCRLWTFPIYHLFVTCESTPSSSAWIAESHLRGVEYCSGLCMLRYGRIDYSKGSANLVFGRKPKTLGGAQGLHY